MQTTAGELLDALNRTNLGGKNLPGPLVCMEARNGVLDVWGRTWGDGAAGLEAFTTVKVSGAGFAGFDMRRAPLATLLRTYEPDEPVNIVRPDAKSATIEVGTSRLVLSHPGGAWTWDTGSDAAPWPARRDGKSVTVQMPGLGEAARFAAKFASPDDSRPILTTLCVKDADGAIEVAATDSYRLAVTEVGPTPKAMKDRALLLPSVAARFLPDDPFEATLVCEKGILDYYRMEWERDGVLFSVRLVPGEFPNYRGLIPKTAPVTMAVERWRLLALLRRVGVARSPGAANVTLRLVLADGRIEAEVNDEMNDARVSDSLEVQMEGLDRFSRGMTVGLNLAYLLDIVRASGDVIQIAFTDERKPWTFTSKDRLVLLMPVRVS